MAERRQFKGIAKDFINMVKLNFIGKGADPNDIFVQDLYNFEPNVNTQSAIKRLMNKSGNNLLTSMSQEDRQILEALLKVYNQHITTKKELLTQARQLFETDIVQTVIDVMIDDGFNSFNNEKEEFRIEYILPEDDKEVLGEDFQNKVQNIIDEFVDKFDIKARTAELVPELLRDGEYAFGVCFDDKENEGVTKIVDDLDVINLLPFYEGNKLSFVMNQEEFEDDNYGIKHNVAMNKNMKMPKVYDPEHIIFFRLKGPTKKRINMSLFYDNQFRQEFKQRTSITLPKYVRVPLPIYYSAMKNLNRLQLMENVSTVLNLSDVLKPEIVSLTIPANTNPIEAQQILRDYERHLNDTGELGNADFLDITTLATQANRRKVLPQWSDSKGALQSTGIGSESKSGGAWDTINNLRNLIALSIGIPPFYININDSPADKAQTIKLYSRYTRKLTSLQKSLADGLKDLIWLHCKKKGLNISKDNINISFKAITSGDSLDDTDMMVATVAGINDLYKGIEEITSSDANNLVIDDEQFKTLFDSLTSRYLNISDLIKISENKFDEQQFQDDDMGFSPSGPSNSSSSFSSDNDFEDLEMSPAEEESIDNNNEQAYQDFASADDGIKLEGPQTITTEG